MPLSANFRREMLLAIKNAKKNKENRDDERTDGEEAAPSSTASKPEVSPAITTIVPKTSEKLEIKSSEPTTTKSTHSRDSKR
ncbi:hypothetical protein B5X24_HaOG204094 [Helicoverpa armigera]|uniref:Uncharacterized protein n=1 Tax=Helicoverpa armigera TaxID=29058 RepID=A0A2W1BPF6_HELAM|nr:hypothetical protein B5X24_HaOG204094 [Helicoverpa armigera]